MRFHSIAPASLSPPLSNLPQFACSTHFCAHCTVFSFLIFRANFACFKFASPLRQAPPSFSASVVFCARHRHRQWPAFLLPHSPTTPSGSLAYRVSISLSSNLGCFFFRISQAANDSDSDNYNYSAAVTRTVNCKRGVPAGAEHSAKQPLLPFPPSSAHPRVSSLFLAIELVSCSCILYEIVCMSV